MFLRETTDELLKEKNLAVYSIASGGDWVANVVAGGEYKDEYANFKPDVFIISGGGNDMVEDQRLKRLITTSPINADNPFLNNYRKYVVLRQNHIPVPLCNASYCPIEYHLYNDSLPRYAANLDAAAIEKIVNGRRYISKDFYRWLVAFKLEYKMMFESLRKIDAAHFDSLKIITQGYDYAIPSSRKKFGIRLFLDNGKWLKKPLNSLGITDQYTQESIIMAMMFDFNEMLIELGKEFPNIYHVDVRGFTRFLEKHDNKKAGKYWFDELHPTKPGF
jgi:lysophospholipase L1-like esterase